VKKSKKSINELGGILARRAAKFYKWTKMGSVEINIFDLKIMMKSPSIFYFEIIPAPSELLMPSSKSLSSI
jgi:hypothetical protein